MTVLVIALAILAIRIAVLAWRVAHRKVAWPRLLLPSIILLEGIGVAWTGGLADLWPVRLGTVIALEVAFVAIAIREVRRSAGGDRYEALARAFGTLLPARLARLAAFEIVLMGSALRFLFGGWRRAIPAGFSYHRESGLRMLLPMLPLLAIGDVLLLELVILPHAATWLKVVVHALAIYGLLWLVGLYATARARPHQVADGRVTLYRGLLRRHDVALADIASVEPLPEFADDWKKRAYLRGALRLDLAGAPVLELTLRSGSRVLAAVDEPAPFIAALRS